MRLNSNYLHIDIKKWLEEAEGAKRVEEVETGEKGSKTLKFKT